LRPAALSWSELLATYQSLFRVELLGDQIASSLIAVGVVLPLLMCAYLYSQYEGVPREVALHWNAHGQVDHVGAPRAVWLLPLAAWVVLACNTLLATLAVAFDRFAARLLTAATLLMQLVMLVALARIVS
jgi:uncharacterized membrane protein